MQLAVAYGQCSQFGSLTACKLSLQRNKAPTFVDQISPRDDLSMEIGIVSKLKNNLFKNRRKTLSLAQAGSELKIDFSGYINFYKP